MNVRVPRSLRDAVDARRAELAARPEHRGHFSRDKWVTNAIRNALNSGGSVQTLGGRPTALPAHRRP
jgi:hypothetical protein